MSVKRLYMIVEKENSVWTFEATARRNYYVLTTKKERKSFGKPIKTLENKFEYVTNIEQALNKIRNEVQI